MRARRTGKRRARPLNRDVRRHMMRTPAYGLVGTLLLTFTGSLQSQEPHLSETLDAEALVQQLRSIPSVLPAMAPSNGVERPTEILRRQIYDRLLVLHPASVRALAQGFQDPDVEFRRNVALALGVLSGGWWLFDGQTRKVDISAAMPALVAALTDTDSRVRAWAAQDIGNIGPNAAMAVPALVILLGSEEEGSRNGACIALRGIGPAARSALPALRRALSDPSADVRQFADLAIKSIEGQ